MRYDQIQDILRNSDAADWLYIPCHGGSGPAYANNWELVNEGSDSWYAQHKSHPHRATYKRDVNLTIAFGMELDADVPYSWLQDALPSMIIDQDQTADFECIDIFWAGSLIDRKHYYAVNSEHVWIPDFQRTANEPELGTVTETEVKFLETVSSLENGSPQNKLYTTRRAVEKVNIRIIDDFELQIH